MELGLYAHIYHHDIDGTYILLDQFCMGWTRKLITRFICIRPDKMQSAQLTALLRLYASICAIDLRNVGRLRSRKRSPGLSHAAL